MSRTVYCTAGAESFKPGPIMLCPCRHLRSFLAPMKHRERRTRLLLLCICVTGGHLVAFLSALSLGPVFQADLYLAGGLWAVSSGQRCPHPPPAAFFFTTQQNATPPPIPAVKNKTQRPLRRFYESTALANIRRGRTAPSNPGPLPLNRRVRECSACP